MAQTGGDAQRVALDDLSGFAALAYRARPSHLTSATADIEAGQRHIGGRPESSLSAPIDAVASSITIDRFT